MEINCKTRRKHDDFTWVCFNGDSEHCADFTEPECCCEFWERVVMNKISVLYIAVNHKDADYFLTELFDKIHSKTSIVQFNRKTFILETETCIVGAFIINSPHRTKTLRGAASYFLESDKQFEMKISRINELYNSMQYKKLWLGINAKEITEEQIIKLLIYGDVEWKYAVKK